MMIRPSTANFRPSPTRPTSSSVEDDAWVEGFDAKEFENCFGGEFSAIRIIWLKEQNNPPANRRMRQFTDELARFLVETQDLPPDSVELAPSTDDTVLEIEGAALSVANVDFLVIVSDSDGLIRLKVNERDARGRGFRELTDDPMFHRGGPTVRSVCVDRVKKFSVKEMVRRIPELVRDAAKPTKKSAQRRNQVGPAVVGGAVAAWVVAFAFRAAITRLWLCTTCSGIESRPGRYTLSFGAATASGVGIGLSAFAGYHWGRYYSVRETKFAPSHKARFRTWGITSLTVGGASWVVLRIFGIAHTRNERPLYDGTQGSYFMLVHLSTSLICAGAGMLAYSLNIKSLKTSSWYPTVRPIVLDQGGGIAVSGLF